MCNPRRVRIRATADIDQAWEATLSRTVGLRRNLTGEARLLQPLGDAIGEPVRQALAAILAAGCEGWEAVADGYRFSVDGGSITYRPSEGTLEIVARIEDTLETSATAEEHLQGIATGHLEVEGVGIYYTDEGNKTEADARREAAEDARRRLAQETRARVDAERQRAAGARTAAVEAAARQQAEAKLTAAAAQRTAQLNQQAAANLRTLGTRCRLQLNQLLASAYREAVRAYIRDQGARLVRDEDNGRVIDIEFDLA